MTAISGAGGRRPPRRALAPLLVALALVAGCAPTGSAPNGSVPVAGRSPDLPPGDDVTVERIVDGDTIVVSGGERVRLIGIDTPETVHPSRPVECFGPEASAHLASLLPVGEPVRLVCDSSGATASAARS